MSDSTLMDINTALVILHNVGCKCVGTRITNIDADAAIIVYQGYKLLEKRIEELEQRITDENSCAVCGACLLLPDEPPHCEDCHPDEYQEISWQRKVRKWEEEQDKKLQKLQGQQQAPGV